MAGQLHFTLEAGYGLLVGFLGAKQLDGGGTAKHRVVGPINDAHPALADLFVERVPAESLGDQVGRTAPAGGGGLPAW